MPNPRQTTEEVLLKTPRDGTATPKSPSCCLSACSPWPRGSTCRHLSPGVPRKLPPQRCCASAPALGPLGRPQTTVLCETVSPPCERDSCRRQVPVTRRNLQKQTPVSAGGKSRKERERGEELCRPLRAPCCLNTTPRVIHLSLA